MGNALSRRPQTLTDRLQQLEDRMRWLEGPGSRNLGNWVVKETHDERVVLTHPASDTTIELAQAPSPPEDTPNEDTEPGSRPEK